ncbi:MAG: nickel-dependent hydrogenase large subunit [Gammaproteobacteria bacterium]|nr:nickel-dependent hydrogenase large subunit [Gammaproteobacteria bacterium]
MSRRVVGPFNRVEGDLEVKLEISDGRVEEAWVVSPMYRGFEQILHGKDPRDALVYAPRICGICSVSQSVAAAAAIAEAQGVIRPPNGDLAINLIQACENLADHFTHFYLFFMPDFAREAYAKRAWYEDVATRFQAVKGSAAAGAMQARASFMHLMGLLAGKWPHTLGVQPGGSTRALERQEQIRALLMVQAFRKHLEQQLFGGDLERIASLESEDKLQAWADEERASSCDLRRFLNLADELELKTLGRNDPRFMSYGSYPNAGVPLFKSGQWEAGVKKPLDLNLITEDISHSWMTGQPGPNHPFQGVTLPDVDAAAGYSWCKSPRLDGKTVEVGALARQLIDGQPLINDLIQSGGGNVRNRVVARLVETARIVLAMEAWCQQLQPKEPYCTTSELPEEAESCGTTEAARGSLGHWLRVKNGRILNYQIIAPTTWNFSPRDEKGTPGPLEQALVNAPVLKDEKDPVSVQHVVRSFDPCMVCTVH